MRPQRPPLGQAQSYIREWGSKPRVDQHRKCVGVCPSAKAGHWGNLRRQWQKSPEIQVRRTAGSYFKHSTKLCCSVAKKRSQQLENSKNPVAAIFIFKNI